MFFSGLKRAKRPESAFCPNKCGPNLPPSTIGLPINWLTDQFVWQFDQLVYEAELVNINFEYFDQSIYLAICQ